MSEMKLSAQWTNDCSGKKDYDGDVLSVSTRYWPRGGGFLVFDGAGNILDNDARPEIKPSAKSSLLLWHGPLSDGRRDNYATLIEREFESETFEEVAAQVEAWAQAQYERAVSVLKQAFSSGEA